jgi:hypothetical protein
LSAHIIVGFNELLDSRLSMLHRVGDVFVKFLIYIHIVNKKG